MNSDPVILFPSELRALQSLDSCILADSIETFNECLREEKQAMIRLCNFPEFSLEKLRSLLGN